MAWPIGLTLRKNMNSFVRILQSDWLYLSSALWIYKQFWSPMELFHRMINSVIFLTYSPWTTGSQPSWCTGFNTNDSKVLWRIYSIDSMVCSYNIAVWLNHCGICEKEYFAHKKEVLKRELHWYNLTFSYSSNNYTSSCFNYINGSHLCWKSIFKEQYLCFKVLWYQKNWTVQESNIAVWLNSWYIAQLYINIKVFSLFLDHLYVLQ